MKYCAIGFMTAFLLSLLLGYIGLPIIKRLKLKQTIYELGPEAHKSKMGTPTMGGVTFLCAALVTSLLFGIKYAQNYGEILYCVCAMTVFGAIGFLDDYLKVVRHRSEGLTPKQKLLPQCVAALIFAVISYNMDVAGSRIYLPFVSELNLGIFYIPIIAFVFVAMDNGANILDGLDGLLTSNASIVLAALCAYCFNMQAEATGIFAACVCGALIAFLAINAHPAKIFMGDTGSLGLGAAICAICVVTKSVLVLPFACVTMVISVGSDILQVVYMKRHAGRKLMRMSPFHHHLAMGGMSETKVVSVYNLITIAGCAAALILFA